MSSTEDSRTLQALHTLQLSEARWQAILDTARDAVICIDTEGRITLFNRAAEDTFGYRAPEVLGQNVRLLMPPPYREEHDEYLHRYRTTGEAKAIGRIREVQARRKNGEIFPIELSVSEARVGEGVIYSAIIRDTSERQAMEAELETARRTAQQRERLADIGAITARIVHDLGNPLAGLAMQAQLILRRSQRMANDATPNLKEPAERIVAEVRRMDHLIKDFLDFTRQQRLSVQPIGLTPFVESLVEFWRPVAAERDIALDFALVDTPPIVADEEKLRRVFDNLIKNAVEAIDRGPGRVAVNVETSSPQWLRVAVADTGPGVPHDVELFRLFETTKPHGSGLGLSIARQIVLAHGGDLTFARLEPRGTAFYVDLPFRARSGDPFGGARV